QLDVDSKGSVVPGKKQQVRLTGHGFYNKAAGTFALADLNMQAAGLDITGEVRGEDLNQSAAFRGKLEIAQFDPRSVLDELGVELPKLQGEQDGKVLHKAALAARFSATPVSAKIEELQVKLDDTAFNGTASVSDFAAPAIA